MVDVGAAAGEASWCAFINRCQICSLLMTKHIVIHKETDQISVEAACVIIASIKNRCHHKHVGCFFGRGCI